MVTSNAMVSKTAASIFLRELCISSYYKISLSNTSTKIGGFTAAVRSETIQYTYIPTEVHA